MANFSTIFREDKTIKIKIDGDDKIINNFIVKETVGSGSFGKGIIIIIIIIIKKY
jgi:hypothetical protein